MKKTTFFLFSLCLGVAAFCQSEKVEVGVENGKVVITKSNPWYASPWVWVVGAAALILLLVALTRGGKRKD